MPQKEFEERTGLKLSADGYTEVMAQIATRIYEQWLSKL